jgi:hypothetical protein
VREARAVGAIESDPSDRPATRVRAGDQDPEGARWTTDQGEPPEDQPGSAQGQDVLRSIGIACSDLGVTKRDERLHLVGLAMMAPRELESTDGLSLNEAREVLPGLARITRAQRDSMWDRLKALGTGEAADAKLLLTSWLEREVRSSDKIAVAEYAVITRELERAEEAEAAREAQEGETGTQEPARKGRPSQARRAAK